MIDVKMISKPKSGSGGGSTKTTVVKQITAQNAENADYAKKAGYADAANKAAFSDNADIATRALAADSCRDIASDSDLWDKFARKDIEETFAENVTFEKGAAVVGDVTIGGTLSVSDTATFQKLVTLLAGLQLDADGTYHITSEGVAVLKSITAESAALTSATIESLTVTRDAHFFKLVIDELASAGGQEIWSAANGKADKVEQLSSGDWRLYWRATDGDGRETANKWMTNDLALCMTSNLTEGVNNNSGNNYWWRLVTAVGTETTEINGTSFECHYIDVSSTDYDTAHTNTDPATGDVFALCGHKPAAETATEEETKRQNAILIAAYNSPDSALETPAIAQYKGISTYSFEGCRYSYLAANGNKITGDIELVSGGELDTRLSKIEVSQDEISLQVGSLATQRRNMLSNSKPRYVSATAKDMWTVQLEAGKTYTLSAEAACSKSVADAGFWACMFVYNTEWTDTKMLSFDSPVPTTESLSITPTATSLYTIRFYIADANGAADVSSVSNPYARLNWAQLEQGSSATPWTLAEGESETNDTMLSGLLQQNGAAVLPEGTVLPDNTAKGSFTAGYDCYFDNSSGASDVKIMEQTGLSLVSGNTYTVSFWAKGTQYLILYLQDAATEWRIADGLATSYSLNSDGTVSSETFAHNRELNNGTDGITSLILSDAWKYFTITFTAKGDTLSDRKFTIVAAAGGVAYIYGLKLEAGGRATALSVDDALTPVGISLKKGRIELKANNVVTVNSAGEETAAIDKDGNLRAGSFVATDETLGITTLMTALGFHVTKDAAGIHTGISESGNPYIYGTDADGNIVWKLGEAGYETVVAGELVLTSVSGSLEKLQAIGTKTYTYSCMVSVTLTVKNNSSLSLLVSGSDIQISYENPYSVVESVESYTTDFELAAGAEKTITITHTDELTNTIYSGDGAYNVIADNPAPDAIAVSVLYGGGMIGSVTVKRLLSVE